MILCFQSSACCNHNGKGDQLVHRVIVILPYSILEYSVVGKIMLSSSTPLIGEDNVIGDSVTSQVTIVHLVNTTKNGKRCDRGASEADLKILL
jgi:hypothetical protein